MALANPDKSVFEQEAWDNLAQMDADMDGTFISSLFDTFLESAPGKLDELKTAVGSGDTDAVGKCAHFLKSSASSLAMMTLSGKMAELEAAGKGGKADDASAKFKDVEKDFAKALKVIEDNRKKLAAA